MHVPDRRAVAVHDDAAEQAAIVAVLHLVEHHPAGPLPAVEVLAAAEPAGGGLRQARDHRPAAGLRQDRRRTTPSACSSGGATSSRTRRPTTSTCSAITRSPSRPGPAGTSGPTTPTSAYYIRGNPLTNVVEPFAGVIRAWQRYVWLPGSGVRRHPGRRARRSSVLAWRRLGGEAAMPWVISVALIVEPAATAEFDYRYVLPAVPFACLAAAMAFGRDTAARNWLDARRARRRGRGGTGRCCGWSRGPRAGRFPRSGAGARRDHGVVDQIAGDAGLGGDGGDRVLTEGRRRPAGSPRRPPR